MKRRLLHLVLVLFTAVSLSSCGYNSMVEKQERVESAWSQVQNVYQRRSDLIPNLVNTVKGAANFEKETLTAVVEARAKATSINVRAEDLTPEKLNEIQANQNQLSTAIGRLLSVAENYPTLQANSNFRDLQVQLEGTENRIAVERKNFNEAVQDYNTYIRKFPNNLTSGMFGFKPKPYFQAQAGSEKAPTVQF